MKSFVILKIILSLMMILNTGEIKPGFSYFCSKSQDILYTQTISIYWLFKRQDKVE